MKYRKLTLDELKTLETQFVQFLVVNSITGKDWEKIKSTNPTRTEQLLDEFSDVVLGSVIEKAKHLVAVEPKQLLFFEIQETGYNILGLSVSIEMDFTQFPTLQNAIEAISDDARLETFFLQKKYTKAKDQEVFDLIESGCRISDEKTYTEVKMLIK
jgi:hypothetical protein